MTPAIRSLNTKLLVIVIGFLVLSGVLGAIRVGMVETARLEALYDQRLGTLATRYKAHLEEELGVRLQMMHAARDVLVKEIESQLGRTASINMQDFQQEDQSYRLIDQHSGIFIPPETVIDARVNAEVAASGAVFERLTPVLREVFTGFYFISEERITRAWPLEIVRDHRPNHDVTEEIFYTIATPENNPQRLSHWTPIYFDIYAKQWMTSLIFPVYLGDQFVGILGGDINVSYLLSRLEDLDADANQIEAFIFDSEGKLVLHSGQALNGKVSGSDKYTLLSTQTPISQDLMAYTQGVIAGKISLDEIRPQQLLGESVDVIATRLDYMNWYISFYYDQRLIDARFRESMTSVYINILVVAVFLFAVLFFSIRHFVIRRISALAAATSTIGRDSWTMDSWSMDGWNMSVPDKGHDEISQLGSSINNMLDHIRHLVQGLDAKISELDRAGHESRRLVSAIENSASLVVIINADWQLEYANSQYWQLTGLDESGQYDAYQLLLLARDNSEEITLEAIHKALTADGKPVLNGEEPNQWQAEYQATLPDGKQFWVMQTIAAMFDRTGELEYYICVGQDISDLKEKQQQVERLAYYDHLTGLANRMLFKTQLSHMLAAGERNKSKLALFYLDLDHFKRINDTFGHEAGDILLKEIARRLQSCLRDEDVVARLGGDEFAVLLDRIESPQYAYVVANKIISTLNQPIILKGKEMVVGVSIGITIAPDDHQNPDVLMKNADLAMYRAKDKGRNALQFYTSDMNLSVERRLTVERELRSALKTGQFELFYQPLIEYATGKIMGAEALIRWNHPLRGLVMPGEFIPEAEDSGLIVPMGKWVLKTACHQIRGIQRALGRDLRLSVNLSARQLADDDFINVIDSSLSSSGLSPDCLEIEVTESTLMEDTETAITRFKTIRERGCSIAIDDFGTGYSSLSYLKRLPINCLKVDRSFVKDLPDDEEDRAITSLIIAMASNLHYKVVVEGVETQAQHDFLAHCGCDYGQGYLYGRPLPADEFMALVFSDPTIPSHD